MSDSKSGVKRCRTRETFQAVDEVNVQVKFTTKIFYDPIFDDDTPNSDYDADPLPETDLEESSVSSVMQENSDEKTHESNFNASDFGDISPISEETDVLAHEQLTCSDETDSDIDMVSHSNTGSATEKYPSKEDNVVKRERKRKTSVVFKSNSKRKTENEVENLMFVSSEESTSDNESDFTEDSDLSELLTSGICSSSDLPRESKFEVYSDDNLKEYRALRNSKTSSEIVTLKTTDIETEVKKTKLSDTALKEAFPGVYAGAFHKINNVAFGFLKISPKTIKPFERTSNMSTVFYTVLQGKVILKSADVVKVGGRLTLAKRFVEQGTCIAIPAGHPYALENRTDKIAVLQYVVTNAV